MKVNILKIDGNIIHFIEDGKKDVIVVELDKVVKPEYVKMGEAEITIKDNLVSYCRKIVTQENTQAQKKESNNPKKKWEDDMVKFEDLLTEAHKKAKDDGLHLNILTTVIRDKEGAPIIDVENKFAFFKSRITLSNGDGKVLKTFEGHGDATSENITGDKIKIHFIRMAETRAIVRALRWYTNNGCAEEEK